MRMFPGEQLEQSISVNASATHSKSTTSNDSCDLHGQRQARQAGKCIRRIALEEAAIAAGRGNRPSRVKYEQPEHDRRYEPTPFG